jgi:uncharacterized protein YoxC
MLREKKQKYISHIDKLSIKATRWIGSTESLGVHTFLFVISFLLVLVGVPFERVLLVLTTLVSLEAIYLSIFIQMSVNRTTRRLHAVSKDVEEIQKDVEGISEDVEEIQKDVEGISEDVEEIQKDVEEIGEDVGEIQEDVEGIEKDVDELQKDVEEIGDDVEEIQKEVGEIGEEVEEWSEEDELEEKKEARERKADLARLNRIEETLEMLLAEIKNEKVKNKKK